LPINEYLLLLCFVHIILHLVFGALIAQSVTDVYGRRRTFIVAALGFIAGVLFMALAKVYATLMFGRFLVGIGVGIGLAIDPLYIAEISPARHRGKLVTYAEIALNVGIVLGFSTGFFFSAVDDSKQWRIM
jgi:MFS family permease